MTDHLQHPGQNADQVLAEQQILARLAINPCEFIVATVGADNPGDEINYTIDDEHLLPFPIATLPIPPTSARAIVLSLCSALGHLHALGIMHRNIKPENLLVPPGGLDGQIKLTSFSHASLQPTAFSLVGTPEFMAPELIRAETYTAVVDWWSLGCLTSELLTGSTPFNIAGTNVETLLRMILWDRIVVPAHPHVGPLERDFITALLERDPNARLGRHGRAQVAAHPWCGGG